jgi:hypothetical protein
MNRTWRGPANPDPDRDRKHSVPHASPNTDPTPTVASVPTRTARSGNGHRVYSEGSLLGYVEQYRTRGATGRTCTRWRASAAAMAFLAPGCPLTGVPARLYRPQLDSQWLPGEHRSKHEAITALLAYLIANKAPAVGFGPHPDVAAPQSGRAAGD